MLVLVVAGASGAAADAGGNMVVTEDGTVVDGAVVNGYILVKADRVTIRNSVVRYGGAHAVRVFPGAEGTLIETSRVECRAPRTNGIVFGNYTARDVHVTGCRQGFLRSPAAPATIIGSTWNGEQVDAEVGAAAPQVPGSVPKDRAAAPGGASGEPRTEADAPAEQGGTATEQGEAAAGPAVAAMPGPSNTGVPDGTQLRRSGPLDLTRNGQVINGLDIVGCVTVSAANVVIRNSRISCDGRYSIRTFNTARNLVVESSEIDGRGGNEAAVCCGNYTLRRVEIRNVIDGPRLGDNVLIEDSWIHHLTRRPGSHNDTLQTTGATRIVVRNNRLDAYNPNTRDPMNACLMIGSTTAPLVADLLYEGNYCNGGNYSIGVRADLKARDLVFRNNTFGRDHRYGVIQKPGQAGLRWDRSSNTYADNRQPVAR